MNPDSDEIGERISTFNFEGDEGPRIGGVPARDFYATLREHGKRESGGYASTKVGERAGGWPADGEQPPPTVQVRGNYIY